MNEETDNSLSFLTEAAPPTADEQLQRTLREEAQFAAIGRVVVAWSKLEHSIDDATLRLLGAEGISGFSLTSQIAGGRKLDAYTSLVGIICGSEALNKELKKLGAQLLSLAEQRNRLIHDPWIFIGAHQPLRVEITARKSLKIMPVPTSTESLLSFAEKIRDMTNRLQQFQLKAMIAKNETTGEDPGSLAP